MAKLKKRKPEKPPVDYGNFLLCNHEKLDRAINGAMGPGGKLIGGVGKNASPEAILAEYDKLAGLIRTKDGRKVATGTFYDFENRCPKKEVTVVLAKEPNQGGPVVNTRQVGDIERAKPKGRKKQVVEED